MRKELRLGAVFVCALVLMGISIHFDTEELDGFVEWKMTGVRDYVLGLECGNCYPDGRKAMRESGMLKFLAPGESKSYTVRVKVYTNLK